jgi:DNA-binding LacI/PurR family transcriptional regulator
LPNTYTNNERVRGYKDALLQNDLPVEENLIVGKDFRKESDYIEAEFLLSMAERPTAIFAASIKIARNWRNSFSAIAWPKSAARRSARKRSFSGSSL